MPFPTAQQFTDPKHQVLAQCAARDRQNRVHDTNAFTTTMSEAFRKAALAAQTK